MRSRITLLALTGTLAVSLVACSSAPVDRASSDSSDDAHGAVAGAEEVAEPQLGLTSIDADGAVTHLDLLDESVTDIGEVSSPSALTTDGRYLFAQTDDGIDIVDSGVWTWDHVDHFHYYRADPAVLGSVPGDGTAAVATTNLSTTGGTGISFAGSGDAVPPDPQA
ncbi:ABC transporter, partial [Microbacterium sp. ISL-103]|nr:ABC transporter [Microbacterium sp. ISL-103]